MKAWFAVALGIHAALVAVLVETWADGYYHMLMSWDIAVAIRDGRFGLGMLPGSWLPAYHLICAIPLLVVNEPYYVPRLVSALFGAGTVAMTFAIARRHAAEHPVVPWMAALTVLTAPHHAFYSSYGMSEAPYTFFLTLTLAAMLRAERGNRWMLLAALAMAPPILMRFESWPLALGLWLTAVVQRRAKPLELAGAALILAAPAAAWMALCAHFSGDPMLSFHTTSAYQQNFHTLYPEESYRSVALTIQKAATIGAVAGFPLLLAPLGAIDYARSRVHGRAVVTVLALVLIQVGTLVALYVGGKHPGWLRYWIGTVPGIAILGALGLGAVIQKWGRARLWIVAFLACHVAAAAPVTVFLVREATWSQNHYEIGRHLQEKPPAGKVLCDEAGSLIHSRLPRDRFHGGSELEGLDRDAALRRLRELGVTHMVWSNVDYSRLRVLFPELIGHPAETPDFVLEFAPPGNALIPQVRPMPGAYLYRLK